MTVLCPLGLPGFLGNSWNLAHFFPPAGYLGMLTFPFGLMKSKAGVTLSKLAILLSSLPGKLWSCLSIIAVLSLWQKGTETQY